MLESMVTVVTPYHSTPSSSSEDPVPSIEPSDMPVASSPVQLPFTISYMMSNERPDWDWPSMSMGSSLLMESSSHMEMEMLMNLWESSTLLR